MVAVNQLQRLPARIRFVRSVSTAPRSFLVRRCPLPSRRRPRPPAAHRRGAQQGMNGARPQELAPPRICLLTPLTGGAMALPDLDPSASAIPNRFLHAAEFRKRSECEDSFDYVGSSSSRIRSSSKPDLRYR